MDGQMREITCLGEMIKGQDWLVVGRDRYGHDERGRAWEETEEKLDIQYGARWPQNTDLKHLAMGKPRRFLSYSVVGHKGCFRKWHLTV